MALGKLPRIQRGIPIVDAGGRALDYFLRLLSEAFTMIERNEASQNETLEAIQELQAQQAAQLGLINDALTLAGIAIGQDADTKTDSATVTITDSWEEGPEVEFLGTVPNNISIASSGVYTQTGAATNFVSATGQVRLVEIDGGVDSVIGGPWSFTVSLFPVPPGDPQAIVISNPPEINSFLYASTTSGDIKYRVDARLTTPGQFLSDALLKTSVKRPA